MRVSEKGTKQYFPRQASTDGTRFQATNPYNGERESERVRVSERERAEKTKRKEGEKRRSGATALGLALF
jgi:hypothetical protein